jgi:hypothetical protein
MKTFTDEEMNELLPTARSYSLVSHASSRLRTEIRHYYLRTQ